MPVNADFFRELIPQLQEKNASLVAVSKTKPTEDIMSLYQLGQRDFGENYVQELTGKEGQLPEDIRWHFIGHLQSNKVKYIAPFVHLIHGVDSGKLLREVDKQGKKAGRAISVLLQVHIAQEETKFGMDEAELKEVLQPAVLDSLTGVKVCGLMGMASFTGDGEKVRAEFRFLNSLFNRFKDQELPNTDWSTLSMGMSGDYHIALEEGSNMVRIGSLLFGAR